ncbi:hypothetical protein PVMG_05930 [Plasmodium vivax Mauritania I]|uniref:VIR protein n=1 Tax=Plasmodium vivax Mauritania I TaxID=1035515 RepID=A0A0J9T2K2_PLAVI|nr:hypothetical protein PVMG_05930 [Plasmodium vivax Mauritania I]
MTFDKYLQLKDKFGPKRNYEYETAPFNVILSKSNIDESVKSTYKSAFSEILRIIHHAIIKYDGDKKGCWYISYILYKEVYEYLKHEYTEKLFNDFKEFIRTYNTHVYSKSSTICLNDMLYEKPETFQIMHELYRLYDEYIDKYRPINKSVINRDCNDFHAFLFSYKNFINTYESGTNFFNGVLNNFHKEIKNAVSTYEAKCTGITYNAGNPHLHTTPPPPKPVVAQPVVRQVDQSALGVKGLQDSRQEEAHLSGESRTQEIPAYVSTHSSEETRDTETTLYTGRSHDRETGNDQLTSDHPGRTHGYGREQEDMIGTESRYSQHFRTTGSSAELGYLDKSPFAPNLEGQNQDDGFIYNVKNTLSGIVQSVEPAPILGVSGGMGVLFLLFKYTPVGSFFGGRRGRIRQIPSGFHGQFLGAFPDMQDYGSGYVGYSPMNINPLAE